MKTYGITFDKILQIVIKVDGDKIEILHTNNSGGHSVDKNKIIIEEVE